MAWRLIYRFHLCSRRSLPTIEKSSSARFISTTTVVRVTEKDITREITIKDKYFDQDVKNKDTFLALLEIFKMKNYKTGHIEFIYAALNRMEDYGVAEDLECYKQIIDVMPKGKMVGSNMWLADFQYYPKHQDCIVDVLSKMEENRVIPDRQMFDILVNTFGKRSSPTLKYLRMMYWSPKMKYASPWPAPSPPPKDKKEAAILAVKRMCSVDLQNELTIFQTEDDELATEDTWIINSQSPIQKTLLKYHPKNLAVYVDGPFVMHLGRKNVVEYFILKADMPKNRRRRKPRDPDEISNLKIPLLDPPTPDDLIPEFSVHEQKDGIIYAVASPGWANIETVQSWIRLLQKNGNPSLQNVPIVFRCSFPKIQSDQLKLPETANQNREKSTENR